MSSTLCSELKYILFEQLDDLRRSIRDYKLFGVDALVEGYKSSLGMVAAHGGLIDESTKTSPGMMDYIDRVNELGEAIDKVEATGGRLMRIAGFTKRVGDILKIG